MKKNINTQQGFSLIETLLLVIAVALVAFVGYYVWHTQKQTDNTLNTAAKTSSSAPASPYTGWNTYTAKSDGLSFKYPSTWKLTNRAKNVPEISSVYLTSPSGNAVGLADPLSGVGGACDPATQPHYIVDKVIKLGVKAKLPLYLVLFNYQGSKSLAVVDGDSSEHESELLTKGDTGQCIIYPTFLSPKTTSSNQWPVEFNTGISLQPGTGSDTNKNIVSDSEFMAKPDIKTAVLIFKSLRYQ